MSNLWNDLSPTNRVLYKNAEGIVVEIGMHKSTPFVVVEFLFPVKGKKTFRGKYKINQLTKIR